MACNNTKYTFLSVGSVCTSVLLWPMVLLLTYSKCREYQTLFIGSKKRREKKCSMEQSHLTVLGHSFSENEIESERTLYIFEHGPIFSCLTTTTIFQRGCHMNGARLHIYWTLKNFRCENLIEKNMHTQWEKEKRWVIEKYMPNWWNSDEVKRLVFFVAPFLDRVLLYFAKMGQNQSNSCNESPFNLLAYCRNDFHSR